MIKKSLLFPGAALFVIAVSAFAATTTRTKDFNGMPGYYNLTFNKFDDHNGLYTLNFIKVTLALNVNGGQIILDNDGEEPASGTFEFGANARISSSDVVLLNSSSQEIPGDVQAVHIDTFNLAGNVDDTVFQIDPNAPDGMQYWGTLESDANTDFVGPFAWASYTGLGTYNILVSVEHVAKVFGGDNVQFFATPANSSGYVTIVYDYIVPEPATITLFCTGTLAFLKRKSSK